MSGFFNVRKLDNPGQKYSCAICGLAPLSEVTKIRPAGEFKKRIMNIFKNRKEMEASRILLYENGISIDDDCVNVVALACDGKPENLKTALQCCYKNVSSAINKYKPDKIILHGYAACLSVLGPRWTKDFPDIQRWRGFAIPDQKYGSMIYPVFSKNDLDDSSFPEIPTIYANDIQRILDDRTKFTPWETMSEKAVKIVDAEEAGEFVTKIINGKLFSAFDFETTGIKPHAKEHYIYCCSISIADTSIVFKVKGDPKGTEVLKQYLVSKAPKAAHNIKFEYSWACSKLGVCPENIVWDSQIAAHILDSRTGTTGLKFQTFVNFGVAGYDDEVSEIIKTKKKGANELNSVPDITSPSMAKDLMIYCAMDSFFTYHLAQKQRGEIERIAGFSDAYDLFHEGTLALSRASEQGIRLDESLMERKQKFLTRKITHLESKMEETEVFKLGKKVYGKKFNPYSNEQIGVILYDEMGIEPLKFTPGGKGAADEEALSQIDNPCINMLLQIRKLQKVRDTYLQQFAREAVDGYVHPSFNLNLVDTYRSSSSNPNFQNIPKRDKEAMKICRSILFPRPGHQLIEVDFSKLEVSIAACYHKDPNMLKYLTSDENDMHADLAEQIFLLDKYNKKVEGHSTLRNAAKNGFIFPQFYGDYYVNNAKGLCQWAKLPEAKWKMGQGIMLDSDPISNHMMKKGISSYDEFVEHIKKIEEHFWNKRFGAYKKWKQKHIGDFQKKGYLEMYTGFRCNGPLRNNQIINYPVQGAAFHCLLWSLIQVDKKIFAEKLDTRIIGQIHDAMVLDVSPEELDYVKKLLNEVMTKRLPKAMDWIIVPLQIEISECPVDAPWSEIV